MKHTLIRHFLIAALLTPAVGLAEHDNKVIHLRGQAVGLIPGTKVSIEVAAEYTVFDPVRAHAAEKAGRQKPDEEGILSREKAAEAHRWEFVVPADGTVPEKEMVFQLQLPSNEPPEGLSEGIFIPVTYSVSLPAGRGQPARTISRESAFGGRRTKFDDRICFRFQGFPDGAFSVGLIECNKKMKHPSKGVPAPPD